MSHQRNEAAGALVDEKLHRLHDGELTDAESEDYAAGLDGPARARLAVIGDVGIALRQAVSGEQRERPGLDVDALWGAIEREIQPAKVLPFRTRLFRAVTRHPVWVSTGMAAAAALAIFMAVSTPGNLPTNGCDIDYVDVTGAAAVTVMKVDSVRSAGTTTVVWVQED